MKIALVVESSTKNHAQDVFDVLSSFSQHEIYNVGMHNVEKEETLTFLHTSMIAGILINTSAVDFVVGGCGTGQGFFNGVMSYPNILCGLITDPLEGWLFMQVNAGNCVSLPMNKGWGLGSKEGLKITFEQMFRVEYGCGYPPERADLIKEMHKKLRMQSKAFRKSFIEIIPFMDREILYPALRAHGVKKLIESAHDSEEKSAILRIYEMENVGLNGKVENEQ